MKGTQELMQARERQACFVLDTDGGDDGQVLVGSRLPNHVQQSRLSDTGLPAQDDRRSVSGDGTIQEVSQRGQIPFPTDQR
ncbi:hypothetical protein GCM10011610_26210 [Nocardia rhizosphaerihabitans]|uniref:Uncharacterized protein n=1 Tax=Nocardia rhizosphaerihabitans TaxID=1691570 RepID=A0ABQ2KBV6_9NOCA|nr:hypothetical protein GCM10011610_26210 [Nocardia rhizosphaerihabitans]